MRVIQLRSRRSVEVEAVGPTVEELSRVVEARAVRGWSVGRLVEGATHDAILSRGLALLGPLAVVVEGSAAEYSRRLYPHLEPGAVSSRAVDKAARYVGRGGTHRSREIGRLATHYYWHREAVGCARCELAARRSRGLGILKARAVIGKGIKTGRGSMPFREGFELQPASPNLSMWIGPEGETIASTSVGRVHPLTGTAAPGSPERDAFRPRGWLARLVDGSGLGTVVGRLSRSVGDSGVRGGRVNWAGVARSLGVPRKKLQKATREAVAQLETIPVDTVGGQLGTAARESVRRSVGAGANEWGGPFTVEAVTIPPRRVGRGGDGRGIPVTSTLAVAMTPTARAGVESMQTQFPCQIHPTDDHPTTCEASLARGRYLDQLATCETRADYDRLRATVRG